VVKIAKFPVLLVAVNVYSRIILLMLARVGSGAVRIGPPLFPDRRS